MNLKKRCKSYKVFNHNGLLFVFIFTKIYRYYPFCILRYFASKLKFFRFYNYFNIKQFLYLGIYLIKHMHQPFIRQWGTIAIANGDTIHLNINVTTTFVFLCIEAATNPSLLNSATVYGTKYASNNDILISSRIIANSGGISGGTLNTIRWLSLGK